MVCSLLGALVTADPGQAPKCGGCDNSFLIYLQTAGSPHTQTQWPLYQVEDIQITRVSYYKDTSMVYR